MRKVAVGTLAEPPVAEPLTVIAVGPKAGHESFGRHLPIAVPQPFAVRTVDVVAAEVKTALRPLIDVVDAVEQFVGARERADLFQVALHQQGDRVLLRWGGREAVNNYVAEAGVLELVLEHFTSFAGGNKLTDLTEMLIAAATLALAGPAIGKGHPDDRSRLKGRHLQPEPAGQGGAEVDLVCAVVQRVDRHRGNLLAHAVDRTRLCAYRPERWSRGHRMAP